VVSELDLMIFRDTKWSGVIVDRVAVDSSDKALDKLIPESGVYF
jgi:hypothetical protein